jgi:two-component system sensor histidine kinase KdpD
MVYFLGVLGVAARLHRRVAIFTSILSVAAFDLFCVPPYLTFAVADYEYLITFAVMLIVALAISAMTSRIRLQALSAADREAQTRALYRLSEELAGQTRLSDILETATRLAEKTFGGRITALLPDDERKVAFTGRTSGPLSVPSSEQGIAQWVFDRGEKAGKGTATLPGASALYVPLKGASGILGVLSVVPGEPGETLSAEQQNLLEVLASQAALAIERNLAASAARDAEVRVETESLRTSLLSTVSHDLRTPLSSITGAAATLRSHWDRLDEKTRNELLESVTDEADRLNRLLDNLLEVTRLEGGVHLRKEMCPLEEVVGAALHRLRRQLASRQVRTDIPADLPMVAMDDVLMEQVFVNLIENALKYTPADSPVDITAARRGEFLTVEVGDRGPGIPEGEEKRIFEKFFRGRTDSARGAGLGLAICRAIVEAHGGSIEALNRAEGGALFRFRIPLGDSGYAFEPIARDSVG